MKVPKWIFIYSLFLIFSCSHLGSDQKLKRLYQVTSSIEMTRPVILVHGILGSKLRSRKTKKEIWPRGFFSLLFSNYSKTALTINSKTLEPEVNEYVPFKLFEHVAGKDFYGKIYSTLTEIGGYQKPIRDGGAEGNVRRIYNFIYDWRQDLVSSAKQFNNLVETIRKDYHNPKLKIDVVAHSMGGLIVRYFVKYGAKDVLNDPVMKPNFIGAKKLNKVILLATPNWGSIYGLQKFIMGYKIGLKKISPETLLTFPSMYQLLPNPARDWMIDVNGKKINRSLYNLDTWRNYKWSIYNPVTQSKIISKFDDKREGELYLKTLIRYFDKNILRAKKFKMALDIDNYKNTLKYIVFGGDCSLTPARCLVEKVNNENFVRLDPNEIVHKKTNVPYSKLMLEPGDGSVTKPSLLGRNTLNYTNVSFKKSDLLLQYSFFLCNEHENLPGDISFQDNLLNILLTQRTSQEHFIQFNSQN